MTALLQTIRDRLVANTGVTSLVAQRVFPNRAEQGAAAPFVVQSVISEARQNTFTGTTLNRQRLQVDCYAKKYLEARAVADAVDAVVSALDLPDLSAWRVGARDLYDDATQLHRVSIDFAVWVGS